MNPYSVEGRHLDRYRPQLFGGTHLPKYRHSDVTRGRGECRLFALRWTLIPETSATRLGRQGSHGIAGSAARSRPKAEVSGSILNRFSLRKRHDFTSARATPSVQLSHSFPIDFWRPFNAGSGRWGSNARPTDYVALPKLEAISTVGPRSRKAVAGACPPVGRYTQYTESETLVDRPAGSLPSGSLSSPVRASTVEATLLKNPPSSTRERGALESFLPRVPLLAVV